MQRAALEWRRLGVRVGFVPTMGCLHEGHLSLIRRARRSVGAGGRVVVSIYVNPAQFAPTEDLAKYPRDFPRDRSLCKQTGVDVIFLPDDRDMYPKHAGTEYSTYVVEGKLSLGMEGASRPTHFRGVTTIVAKLFNIVQPEMAVFGEKDFQQAAVIRRMTADLNFPVKIVVAPTGREADGLAMSSRNRYLDPAERSQAVVLSRLIKRAREMVGPAPVPTTRLKRELKAMLTQYPLCRIDYLEIVDEETLVPMKTAKRGHRLALAAYLGETRLIDNGRL